jgi:hypothetical protein
MVTGNRFISDTFIEIFFEVNPDFNISFRAAINSSGEHRLFLNLALLDQKTTR